ncbi:MAG: hypothetical protein CMN76_16610 [Spirochaetaceae bacterium]|nr:hypothetical protein [Spirochaetaceae bacterium]
MTQAKRTITILGVVAIATLFSAQCKDKGKEATTDQPSTTAVELTGTPGNKMITVMEMGVKALESNATDPAKAASELNRLMQAYDITAIRAEAKAAKEAGQGASEAEKTRFKELTEKYKNLATEVGKNDPAAFGAAHAEWSKLWSIN